jgi:hypothetical protein
LVPYRSKNTFGGIDLKLDAEKNDKRAKQRFKTDAKTTQRAIDCGSKGNFK